MRRVSRFFLADTTTLKLSTFFKCSKDKDTLHHHHAIQKNEESTLIRLSRLHDAGIIYLFRTANTFSQQYRSGNYSHQHAAGRWTSQTTKNEHSASPHNPNE
jgi:hypothetical protein